MKRVFKYPLEVTDFQDVNLPLGAEILKVEMQQNCLQMWALVDDDVTYFSFRKIRIAGTGHVIEGNMKYISTFFMADGSLVFHVFEDASK